MSITTCKCARAHVRKVRTTPLSAIGEGEHWRAARPGNLYLAGHGLHFDNWQDAINYASATEPEAKGEAAADWLTTALNDPEGQALVQAIHDRKHRS